MDAGKDRPFVPNYYFAALSCALLTILGGGLLGGGFFCMLPGLAERSWRKLLAAFPLGVISAYVLFGVTTDWFGKQPTWFINGMFSGWYPHTTMTMSSQGGGTLASAVIGLEVSSAIWLVTMSLVAMALARPPLRSWRALARLPFALVFQQALLRLPWASSPMSLSWLPRGYRPDWAQPAPFWVITPIASVVAFCLTLVWRLNRPARASRDAQAPNEREPEG